MNPDHPFIEADWILTNRRDRALDDAIVGLVRPGDRVLDLGCGRGDLLHLLRRERKIRDHGLEIDGDAVAECIARGLTVVQGDLEEGLSSFKASTFDLVVVNQVLPLLPNPTRLIGECLRVGSRVVVTFPNFSHWKVRSQLFFTGKLPVTESLPYRWHETPHIRYLSIADFRETCRENEWEIECERYVRQNGAPPSREIRFMPNIRASLALFLLRKA